MYVPLPRWAKGMNSVLPDHGLPVETARAIVNHDVDDSGRLLFRPGASRLYACTPARRTLWADGEYLYFV